MTTSTTAAETTMRAIIQENYGETENALRLGHAGRSAIENKADLIALTELIDSGQVTPVIDKIHPLSQTITAIRHVRDGHTRGKVVINISDASLR